KFAGGLTLVGISFFVFLLPLTASSDGSLVNPWWLVSIYFFQTVGELMLSPVGLSVTTKMAPAKYASQMMGVWFLAVTAGDSVTGLLSDAGVNLNRTGVVTLEAALAVAGGIAIFMYRRKVKNLMGEIH
ncbi:oligopeptide:H+ symporter, partial [Streptomyces albidoflavus]